LATIADRMRSIHKLAVKNEKPFFSHLRLRDGFFHLVGVSPTHGAMAGLESNRMRIVHTNRFFPLWKTIASRRGEILPSGFHSKLSSKIRVKTLYLDLRKLTVFNG